MILLSKGNKGKEEERKIIMKRIRTAGHESVSSAGHTREGRPMKIDKKIVIILSMILLHPLETN